MCPKLAFVIILHCRTHITTILPLPFLFLTAITVLRMFEYRPSSHTQCNGSSQSFLQTFKSNGRTSCSDCKVASRDRSNHRCDKRLQRLQKILCKRVYYFVNVYLNKKAQLSLTNPRDAKACQNCSNSTCLQRSR